MYFSTKNIQLNNKLKSCREQITIHHHRFSQNRHFLFINFRPNKLALQKRFWVIIALQINDKTMEPTPSISRRLSGCLAVWILCNILLAEQTFPPQPTQKLRHQTLSRPLSATWYLWKKLLNCEHYNRQSCHSIELSLENILWLNKFNKKFDINVT